mgnify:CR=1 FL=1
MFYKSDESRVNNATITQKAPAELKIINYKEEFFYAFEARVGRSGLGTTDFLI